MVPVIIDSVILLTGADLGILTNLQENDVLFNTEVPLYFVL